jgi:serine/threonine protein kinase
MDKKQDKTILLNPRRGGDGPSKGNALPNGHVLQGRYLIEARLGAGGFGITYLAKHRYLEDLWVAIKEYLPEGAAVRDSSSRVHAVSEHHKKIYSWGLHRFLDEARLLRQFKHPNIVSVEDFFEANETAYMVMNYVRGRSIQADLDAGRQFSEDELRKILYPILDALRLIHLDGLYHRDISPDNILLREENDSPVLIDFGSARYEMRMHGVEETPGDPVHAPTAIFKQGYSPIEQYEGTPQGPYTDIYALGATLYRTAFRTRPVDALKRSGEIRLAQHDPLVTASEKGKGQFSEDFLRAIDASLRLEAAERPQDIDEWTRILGITDQQRAEAPTLVMRRRRRPWWPKALVAAVLIATVGAGALWYGSFRQSQIPTDVPSLLARAADELEGAPFDERAQDRARQFYLNVLNQDRNNARALAGYSAANTLNLFTNALAIEDRTNAAVLLVNAESDFKRAGADHKVLELGWKRIELLHRLTGVRDAVANLRLADDDWSAVEGLIAEIEGLPGGKPLAEAARNGLGLLVEARESLISNRFAEAHSQLDSAEQAFSALGISDVAAARAEIEDGEAHLEAERVAQVAEMLKIADTQLRQSPPTIGSLRAAMDTYDQILSINNAQSGAQAGRAMLEKLLAGFAAMDEGKFNEAAQFIDSAEKIAVNSGIRYAPIEEAKIQLKAAQRDWSVAKFSKEVEGLFTKAAEQLTRDPLDMASTEQAGKLYRQAQQISAQEQALSPQQRLASRGIELVAVLRKASEALRQQAFERAREHLDSANAPALAGAIGLGPALTDRVSKLIDAAEINASIQAAATLFEKSAQFQREPLDAIDQYLDRVFALSESHPRALAMAESTQALRRVINARLTNDYEGAQRSLQETQDKFAAAGLPADLLASAQQTLREEAMALARQQRERSMNALMRQAFAILADEPFSPDAWSTSNRVFRAIEAMQEGDEAAADGQKILEAIQQAHAAMTDGRFDSALQSIDAAERLLKPLDGLDLDAARAEIVAAREAWDIAIQRQIKQHIAAATDALGNGPIDADRLEAGRRAFLEAQGLRTDQTQVMVGLQIITALEQYLQALAGQDFGAAEEFISKADDLARQEHYAEGLFVPERARLEEKRKAWVRIQTIKSIGELIAKAAAEVEANELDEAHLERAARFYRQAIELNTSDLSDKALSTQATAGLETVFLLNAFKAEIGDRQYAALQQTLLQLRDRLSEANLDPGIADRLRQSADDNEIAWRRTEVARFLNSADWLANRDLSPAEEHLKKILDKRPNSPDAMLSLKGVEQLRDMLQAYRDRDYASSIAALDAAMGSFAEAGLDNAGLKPIKSRMQVEQQRWLRLTRNRDLITWTSAAVSELNRSPFSSEAWERARQSAEKILALQDNDPRGLAVNAALEQLQQAKTALSAQDFNAAREYVAQARAALVAIGLRQPLQRAAGDIQSEVQRLSPVRLAAASKAIIRTPLTNDQLVEAGSTLEQILADDPGNLVAQTGIAVLDHLKSARSNVQATRFLAAERELNQAFELVEAASVATVSPLPELATVLSREQSQLAVIRPNPGEIYPIVGAALGQITGSPLDLVKLDSAERLLRNVLGMQADEPIALTGLQAVGHLRACAEALSSGELESARAELKAADQDMINMGLAPDTLQSAWQAIEKATVTD